MKFHLSSYPARSRWEKRSTLRTLATEAKALKQITFPEMDDDGLPSAYLPKVLGCLGKWQMKMHDLSGLMGESSEATMKPFTRLVFRYDNSSLPSVFE